MIVILVLFVLIANPLLAQSACDTPENVACVTAPADPPVIDEAGRTDGPAAPDSSANPASSRDADAHVDTHMFGVLPNYSTVERAMPSVPLAASQKFRLAALNTFDPYVYPFVGFVATLNHTYGSGLRGFVKQYPASLADNSIGNFMTSAVLPSALHQDPRYFERGSGTFLGRLGYAASRSVVTRSDDGRPQFNISEIGGNAVAAGISNLYYPAADRTMTGTLSRWGMQLMWDALSNELKEFWPDVRNKLHGQ